MEASHTLALSGQNEDEGSPLSGVLMDGEHREDGLAGPEEWKEGRKTTQRFGVFSLLSPVCLITSSQDHPKFLKVFSEAHLDSGATSNTGANQRLV